MFWRRGKAVVVVLAEAVMLATLLAGGVALSAGVWYVVCIAHPFLPTGR